MLRCRLISSSILVRWGALAAMAGGILLVVFPLLGYIRVAVPFFGVMVVGLLLVPVGMVSFHALQRQRYGRVGIAGFCLVVISSLVVAFGVADYFVWGDLLQQAPPAWLGWGLVGLVIGFVLYGIATLQAKVLPRLCGVTFLVALPLALALSFLLPLAFTPILFGLAWLALGYALWARRGAPVEQQPRRVR
jgi:hypothetical protein